MENLHFNRNHICRISFFYFFICKYNCILIAVTPEHILLSSRYLSQPGALVAHYLDMDVEWNGFIVTGVLQVRLCLSNITNSVSWYDLFKISSSGEQAFLSARLCFVDVTEQILCLNPQLMLPVTGSWVSKSVDCGNAVVHWMISLWYYFLLLHFN